MATSGDTTFDLTRTGIIYGALRLLNKKATGQSVDSELMADAATDLNEIIKEWQNDGVGIWLETEATVLLQKDTQSYSIGPSGDHVTTDYSEGTLTSALIDDQQTIAVTLSSTWADADGICTAEATPNGSVPVDGAVASSSVATLPRSMIVSITSTGDDSGTRFVVAGTYCGMRQSENITGPNATTVVGSKLFDTVTSVGVEDPTTDESATAVGTISVGYLDKYIGIENDDGELSWHRTYYGNSGEYAIGSATDPTASVGVDGACAAGNTVYLYSKKLPRPLEIMAPRFVNTDDAETPINIVTRKRYLENSDKTTSGSCNQVYYHPTLTNGTLYTYPVCDDIDTKLKAIFKITVEDIDSADENAQFPPNFLMALKYALAVELGLSLGVADTNPAIYSMIMARANSLYSRARRFDTDKTNLEIQPELVRR